MVRLGGSASVAAFLNRRDAEWDGGAEGEGKVDSRLRGKDRVGRLCFYYSVSIC